MLLVALASDIIATEEAANNRTVIGLLISLLGYVYVVIEILRYVI